MNNLSAQGLFRADDLSSDRKWRRIHKISVISAAFIAGYLFSLWLLDAYYLGDPEHYARFYYSMYGVNPEHWGSLQKSHLGSAEPFYRYIVGVPAYFGVDRIEYIAVWNGIFTSIIGYILLNYRSSIIFSVFVFTNYYFIILLGSAERLKFSYIFLALAVCLGKPWKKYLSSIISVFFHTQALIQFISSFAYYAAKNYKALLSSPMRILFVSLGVAISLALAGYLFLGSVGDVVAAKSAGYSERSGGVSEVIQWFLLLIVGVYVFRDKIAIICGMLPMGLFTFMYGNRVNVATFAFFAIMAMAHRKTNNPWILMVMAYMSFKSIQFIQDIIQFGTGYP